MDRAVALLAGATGDVRMLAGGTDLLVQMRSDVVDPDLIVDIKKIPETRAIAEEKGGWRIGAAVTGAELKEHPRLKQVWPGVIEAATHGSTQMGRATWRQSVRPARGRQRAGSHRGAATAPWPGRGRGTCPSRTSCSGPASWR
jgi:hypothetical protein